MVMCHAKISFLVDAAQPDNNLTLKLLISEATCTRGNLLAQILYIDLYLDKRRWALGALLNETASVELPDICIVMCDSAGMVIEADIRQWAGKGPVVC